MSRLTEKASDFKTYGHYQCRGNAIDELGKIEDLMEKYDINDLVELEIALDYYKHRYDNVQTRRVDR